MFVYVCLLLYYVFVVVVVMYFPCLHVIDG